MPPKGQRLDENQQFARQKQRSGAAVQNDIGGDGEADGDGHDSVDPIIQAPAPSVAF